ncbi:hypothetical protein K435DRAFT_797322 [Dendrothele bispora CBS 962.96]|uniref:Uncharacterized protein n=1 Tax=Dendrothele bispora (strain CBS 962.96) TaxID=1314807 RepID=A0A4S8M3F3_DENBC|nr:hypothetical protein K435DRAFT_797322 [Dendrothele bispora CBS 962.96]
MHSSSTQLISVDDAEYVYPKPSSGSVRSEMKTGLQAHYPTITIEYPRVLGTAGPVKNRAAGSIPKPDGENGRPGRGGYALKDVLGWDQTDYKKAQDFVKELVATILGGDTHIPFQSQPPQKLEVVRDKMLKQFPQLADYEDNWATDDFIRAALKYRQTCLKKHKLELQAAQGQAILNMRQGLKP